MGNKPGFDTDKLAPGDVFYGVEETNTTFNRKRIYTTIDGVDWWRYDKPAREYEVVTYRVLGVIEKVLSGEWSPDDEYDLEKELYVSSMTDKQIQKTYTGYLPSLDSNLFLDKQDAIDMMNTLVEAARKYDVHENSVQ